MALSAQDKDIKFPTNHYVGFQARGHEDGVPLGFMTPDGTDQAAMKRKATVDNWAKGHGRTKTLPAQQFENKPMSGFKLGREVRHGHGWGQGNVKWRIEDPRGFELEISSPNLAAILTCSTIEKGEILDKCMWARLKSENILVPVTAEVYQAAVANTERTSKSASLKDLAPGNKVVLQNGTEGTFLGSFYTFAKRTEESGAPSWSDKKRFFIMTAVAKDEEDDVIPARIEVSASLKLSSIDDSTSFTAEEGATKIHKWLKKKDNDLTDPGSGYGRYIQLVSTSKDAPVKITLEETTFEQMKKDSPAKVHYWEYPKYLELIQVPYKGTEVLISFAASQHQKAIDEYTKAMAAYQAKKAAAAASGSRFWESEPRISQMNHTFYDLEKYQAEGVLEMKTSTDNYYRKLQAHSENIWPQHLKLDEAKFLYVRVETTDHTGKEVSFLMPYR